VDFPRLQFEQIGPRRLKVTRTFLYYDKSHKCLLMAPEGFVFDGASVPKLLRWYADPLDFSLEAACFHDLLTRCRGVLPLGYATPFRRYTRLEADQLFRQINQDFGVTWHRVRTGYRGVRLGGWWPWIRGTPGVLRLVPEG